MAANTGARIANSTIRATTISAATAIRLRRIRSHAVPSSDRAVAISAVGLRSAVAAADSGEEKVATCPSEGSGVLARRVRLGDSCGSGTSILRCSGVWVAGTVYQ